MRRVSKRKKYVIFSLVGGLLLMAAGFAAYNQRLNVADTSGVTTTWDVSITNVTTSNIVGKASNNADPTWDRLNANFDVTFEKENDAIEYDVTVTNSGSVGAYLNNIVLDNTKNNNVSFTYDGISAGDLLAAGESKTFKVKLLYNGGLGSGAIDLTMDYGEGNEATIPSVIQKVTYDYSTNGGTSVSLEEQTYSENDDVDLTVTAEKEGYDFIGWNTNKNAKTGLETFTMPDHSVILYAIFKEEIQLQQPTIKVNENFQTVEPSTSETNPWIKENDVWKSNNKNISNGTSELIYNITLSKTQDIYFEWTIASGDFYSDYLYYSIYKDDALLDDTGNITQIGGNEYGTAESNLTYNKVIKSLEPGSYTIKFTHYKSYDYGDELDTAYVKNFKILDNTVTINYPSGCNDGIKCIYNLNGTETEVTENSITVPIPGEYKIVAKTTIGNKEKTEQEIFDITPPNIEINSTSTSRSITAIAVANDSVSDIVKYEFKVQKDGEESAEWIDNKDNNVFSLDNLKSGSGMTVFVRVTNSLGLSSTVSKWIHVNNISEPTFSETGSYEKVVTITYPEGCGNKYNCSYVKDDENEVSINSETVEVNFSSEGTLIAKVNDGYNYITSSTYTVMMPETLDSMKQKALVDGGLYEDTLDEGRYIYKGNDAQNKINIDGSIWNILSVESDNSLKLLAPVLNSKTFTVISGGSFATEYYNSLSAEIKNMIVEHTVNYGYSTYETTSIEAQINAEKTKTKTAFVSTITVSDYLRANSDVKNCGSWYLYNSNVSSCRWKSYLDSGSTTWTQTAYSSGPYNYAFAIVSGRIRDYGVSNSARIYPVVQTKPIVKIDGIGSYDYPYKIVEIQE